VSSGTKWPNHYGEILLDLEIRSQLRGFQIKVAEAGVDACELEVLHPLVLGLQLHHDEGLVVKTKIAVVPCDDAVGNDQLKLDSVRASTDEPVVEMVEVVCRGVYAFKDVVLPGLVAQVPKPPSGGLIPPGVLPEPVLGYYPQASR
jgi:hypothetical protein